MSTTEPVPGHPGWLLAFCLLTLLFFASVPPYQTGGDELLLNGDFTRSLDHWQTDGGPGSVSTEDGLLTIQHPAVRSTTLAQCWLRGELPKTLLLSAEARAQGVVRGTERWHMARIDLVGYNAAGEGQYQLGTRLLNLEQDQPWQQASAVFELERELHRVCLEISLYEAPGRFQVQGLSLQPGAEYLPFKLGRYALLIGWLVFAFLLGASLYRHFRDSVPGRWLLLMVLLVLAGVLLPHDVRFQIEQWIYQLLAGIGFSVVQDHRLGIQSAWALWPEQWDLSKLAHLAGFSMLGLILASDRRLSLLSKLTLLVVWAIASEILQFFVPQRTPRLSDLTVDLLGIVIGMALAGVWQWVRRSEPE